MFDQQCKNRKFIPGLKFSNLNIAEYLKKAFNCAKTTATGQKYLIVLGKKGFVNLWDVRYSVVKAIFYATKCIR